MRSSVLTIREQDYVAADRALGVSSGRILHHRVLPNALTPLEPLQRLAELKKIAEAPR